jgi:hypothetical protein
LTNKLPFYGLKRIDNSGVPATRLLVSQAPGQVWHLQEGFLLEQIQQNRKQQPQEELGLLNASLRNINMFRYFVFMINEK